MAAVDVGALGDFADGRVTRVRLSRREIGLLRWRERVYAFADRCPHMGAPICSGRVVPHIEGTAAGGMVASSGEPVLSCPWHGWEFALASGRALTDEGCRLRTYAAEVADGRVLVDAARHSEGARAT